MRSDTSPTNGLVGFKSLLYPCQFGQCGETAMPVVEGTSSRLVLKSGSTTATLDKDTGKITFERKILFWQAKPTNADLADVTQVSVDTAVDRASGVDVCSTMVVFRGGQGWALPAADKKEAQANAAKMREFLGLPQSAT
jgi:hypothetical protein